MRIGHEWVALAESGPPTTLHVRLQPTTADRLTPVLHDDTLPAAGTRLPGEAPVWT
jgi:hypothetical protein